MFFKYHNLFFIFIQKNGSSWLLADFRSFRPEAGVATLFWPPTSVTSSFGRNEFARCRVKDCHKTMAAPVLYSIRAVQLCIRPSQDQGTP
jgi:hypothetical protein